MIKVEKDDKGNNVKGAAQQNNAHKVQKVRPAQLSQAEGEMLSLRVPEGKDKERIMEMENTFRNQKKNAENRTYEAQDSKTEMISSESIL